LIQKLKETLFDETPVPPIELIVMISLSLLLVKVKWSKI